ncbi:MAG: CapA family protein [Roseburia sp.]
MTQNRTRRKGTIKERRRRQHRIRQIRLWLVEGAVVLLLILGLSLGIRNASKEEDSFLAGIEANLQEMLDPAAGVTGSLEPEEEYDVTLMAVGDNLIHMPIVNEGTDANGNRNYDFLFTDISDYLENADVKIINQESVMAGNDLGFSAYPGFNSPTEIGDAIADAGFNVVLQASNHSLDKGLDGLYSTIDFWQENHPEVTLAGVYGEEGGSDIPTLEVEGITFAVLNYAYAPNNDTIYSSIRGHLNILSDYDTDTGKVYVNRLNPQVIEDIKEAEKIADVVVVCPHWGNEYWTEIADYQREFAQEMTEAGADVIIGTHPHVVEPVEWIRAENGNESICYYSLGNYVSSAQREICMLEGMAWVTFHVTPDGVTIDRENTGVLPMVLQYNYQCRMENIYMLEDYNQELANAHGISNTLGRALSLENLNQWSKEILGDAVISKKVPLRQ